MEFRSEQARERYHAFVAAASGAVIGLDFDGTLAPIVSDPEQARIHPDSRAAMIALAEVFPTIAVITGRPVAQVLDLGDMDQAGREIRERGGELFIYGQYGYERWNSQQKQITSPEPPAGLAELRAEVPEILIAAQTPDVWLEDKGLALALHTRRCANPEAAYDRLLPQVLRAARRHELDVEPGRRVIEIRQARVHKGIAVQELAAVRRATGFCFIGDDLGDLAAFRAVAALAEQGLATLLVASASGEESALVDLADVVVPGPDGVAEFLNRMVASVSAS